MQSRGQSWYQQVSSRNPESYQHIVQPERRIAKCDLQLNVFRHKKAQLLWIIRRGSSAARLYCDADVCLMLTIIIWFSDEKIFTV